MLQASYERGSTGSCQYLEQKSSQAKNLVCLKSLISASIMGIGHYSGLVTALTERKLIVVLNLDLESLGTKSGADCQEAGWHLLMNPMP